jgi:hypothetical protein
MQPLLWTTRSLRNLADELANLGHEVCPTVVGGLLRGMGYSLQANSKTREGGQYIDRDRQFHYINTQAKAFPAANEPVISVDTKRKELVGNFKNNGREWRRNGAPELVNVHDFIDPKLSRAVPYGVYDVTNNVGWVSVGTGHDTAAFAVNAIRRWWRTMGKKRHRKAKRLMITADGGGSNGYRVRLWSSFRSWPMSSSCPSRFATCHPARASGIRSSTAFFPSSRSIGEVNHCAAIARSSN